MRPLACSSPCAPFGEQREIVGVETEVEIERTLRAHGAVDSEAGAAGAEPQLVESPVLAVLEPTWPLPEAALPRSLPRRSFERDVENAVAAERLAAGAQLKSSAPVEAGAHLPDRIP